MEKNNTGKVISAYGNLLHVELEKNIRQGEVGYVKLKDLSFASEVIEIAGNVAKLQVFEDTSGIKLNTPVLSGVQGSKEREASVRALEDFKH